MKIQDIKPIKDLVLIEIIPNINSGIITQISKSSLDRPTQGKVLAIGPEVKGIEVNDIVVFGSNRGQDLDKNHMFLGYKTILGILKS